ncbi:unnamed protein product [Dibothriocephalus latus]|uniref:Uncharacterized protein n=1 Tax=Dibothriocephalus latus TaxID=60516 RepID=A0A3P7LSK7_DIBLA|nr:unnamed protein product [Dibothriocephalus latus]
MHRAQALHTLRSSSWSTYVAAFMKQASLLVLPSSSKLKLYGGDRSRPLIRKFEAPFCVRVCMAFTDGKMTQVTKGPCNLPPIANTSVDAVTRSESRRKSSLTFEDLPPPSPHFFETTRLLSNAAPNKGNQTPVRLSSVRQNGRVKRQSTLRGSLPYIGENCEDFPGDKPEMIER